jgi:hypothetical protein
MSGAHAASAKNGSPIETANSPMSHNAAQLPGGSPQPEAIDKGSVRPAAISSTRWMATAIGGRSVRIRTWA